MGNENSQALNFTAKPQEDPFGTNYDQMIQQAENDYFENYCGVGFEHSDDLIKNMAQNDQFLADRMIPQQYHNPTLTDDETTPQNQQFNDLAFRPRNTATVTQVSQESQRKTVTEGNLLLNGSYLRLNKLVGQIEGFVPQTIMNDYSQFKSEVIDLKNNLEQRVQNFRDQNTRGQSGGEWFQGHQQKMGDEYKKYVERRNPNATMGEEIEQQFVVYKQHRKEEIAKELHEEADKYDEILAKYDKIQDSVNEMLQKTENLNTLDKENEIVGPNNTLILQSLGHNVQRVVNKIHDMYRSEPKPTQQQKTQQPQPENDSHFQNLFEDQNLYEVKSIQRT